MTIQKKIRLALAVSLSVVFMVLCVVNWWIVRRFADDHDELSARHRTTTALLALDREMGNLLTTTEDWAAWDDTYAFIEERNPEYIQANLVDETFSRYRFAFMVYVDTRGELVFGKGFDPDLGRETPIPAELLDLLAAQDAFLIPETLEEGTAGLLRLTDELFFIASQPILTSEARGPSRGTLLVGKPVDLFLQEYVSYITQLPVRFHLASEKTGSGENWILDQAYPVRLVATADSLTGFGLMNDVFGNPALEVEVFGRREFLAQAHLEIGYMVFALAILGLLAIGFITYFLDTMVLNRLQRLYRFVMEIGPGESLARRIDLTGGDELSELGHAVNGMLDDLEEHLQEREKAEEMIRSRNEELATLNEELATSLEELTSTNTSLLAAEESLKSSELKYRSLFTTMQEAFALHEIVYDQLGRAVDYRILEVNPAYENITGIGKAQAEGRLALELYGTDPPPYLENYIRVAHSGRPEKFETFFAPMQKYFSISIFSLGQNRFATVVSDITARWIAEEKIRYLSFHDALTQCFNRAFIEEELRRLSDSRDHSLGVVLCDVNGLKLTNDAFGHPKGDRLLQRFAWVLRETCRKEDLIGRWGGDEFIILLPRTPEKTVLDIVDRIREACRKIPPDPIPLSVSLGWAVKVVAEESADSVIALAEERMYRSKLAESRETRSSIISFLKYLMRDHALESEEHVGRLGTLGKMIGEALGLPENDLAELDRLAHLHDLGKVAISETILQKPNSLTSEEWDMVKKHPEVGYRIIQSSPELASIAEAVLTHHEHWDGTGYPQGLSGEEIPLLARIIAVVDAFEVMTSGRPPYKKPMTTNEGIAELIRCAGSQFDPRVVEVFVGLMGDQGRMSQ